MEKHKMPRKTKCYLDNRRNCFHPELKNNCEESLWVCTEIKPIRGELHMAMEDEIFLNKHPEMRKALIKIEDGK